MYKIGGTVIPLHPQSPVVGQATAGVYANDDLEIAGINSSNTPHEHSAEDSTEKLQGRTVRFRDEQHQQV